LGAVTPVGIGVADFWSALLAGTNGIGRVTHFDPSDYRSKLAAEVKDFAPEKWLDRKAAARMARFTQFACAAGAMALADAGLDHGGFAPDRAGVIIGSGIGGSKAIEDGYDVLQRKGPGRMSPLFVSRLLVNMASSQVSILHGLKGPISAPSVACSTGANAIGDAFRIVARGDADIMVAGSSEACITPLAYGGFCAARSMSVHKNPEKGCRPFDLNRDGFVMGEGAGLVILEELEHARNRGTRIYGEMAGYGCRADAFHLTAPDPEGNGMASAMRAAIDDAGMASGEIGYVNAHGTSTVLNDKCESLAIRTVFGDSVDGLKISSNKSMIGHLLAGAGAVEFVATVMAVYEGRIPPTINYRQPDPDCPLDYVINGAESLDLNAAISNSFGFGGGNACLVFRKLAEYTPPG
jgi:3-oxoacyl-[acyl-carrier-protein] synthase II